MKIGILSLPMWYNYGGILQTYALQTVLNNLGHETIYINRHHRPKTSSEKLKTNLNKFVKKTILGNKNYPLYPSVSQKAHISQNTLKFIDNEINPITNKLFSFSDLKNESIKKYDAFVVGSDQVWRPNYVPNIYNYYLDFVDNDLIKVSYAASFGTDAWEYTQEESAKCKELLQSFTSVSVREDSAVKLCESKYNVTASHVVDPTMLIPKEHYVELINKYENEPKTEKGLFTYILDENEEAKKIIDKVARAKGLTAFRVMPKPFDGDFSYKKEEYIFPQLTKWLKAINDAEFIIADSFHGSVFAILFNKPFIAIGNVKRGLSRFTSLFKMFGLESRLILNINDLDDAKINEEIDWKSVNEILHKEINTSTDFLKNCFK